VPSSQDIGSECVSECKALGLSHSHWHNQSPLESGPTSEINLHGTLPRYDLLDLP
jgi:hypothetical protein